MKSHMQVIITVGSLFISAYCWSAGGVIEVPRGIAPDRFTFYPETESLAKDEIRFITGDTGMPVSRHGQMAE
jgi:hypothetical protein